MSKWSRRLFGEANPQVERPRLNQRVVMQATRTRLMQMQHRVVMRAILGLLIRHLKAEGLGLWLVSRFGLWVWLWHWLSVWL